MPKYQVNSDRGYPIGSDTPKYKFGETFDSDSWECAADVDRGYLVLIEEPRPTKKKASPEPDPS